MSEKNIACPVIDDGSKSQNTRSSIQSLCDNLQSVTCEDSSNESCDSGGYDSAKESLGGGGDQLLNNEEWLSKKKHLFILSESGKPVYSRYGQEDRLVTLYGLLQALVSIVSVDGDVLRCIQAGRHKIVFLIKTPLIMATVADSDASMTQLMLQLIYVNSQVESVSTRAALQRTYTNRRNCDLRDLLGGTDRLISSLLDLMDKEPGLMLGAYQSLPLQPSVRLDVIQAITQACSKIKNVVFGVVLTGLQVVCIVRLKGCTLQPADLHLLCNLVYATDSLRASENWMPICLPQFDPNGYLYGHVSYLSENCDACLLLLTVEKEHFFTLSTAKQKITEKLRRQHVLEKLITSAPPISAACYYASDFSDSDTVIDPDVNTATEHLDDSSPFHTQSSIDVPSRPSHDISLYTVAVIGCPELRHFIYKNRTLTQYTAPAYTSPYSSSKTPLYIYQRLQQRLQEEGRELKMIYVTAEDHAAIGWVTAEFELFAALEPLTTKQAAIVIVNKILKYIKQEESRLFILNIPTF